MKQTTTPVKITAALLREWRAICPQLATFEREWPEGAEITAENMSRARALGLNVEWVLCCAAANNHLAVAKFLRTKGAR